MLIKVYFNTITPEQYDNVCDFYNKDIPENLNSLEKLDRQEGGFKISIRQYENSDYDPNEKIKQVRWSKKHLVTNPCYIAFNEEETQRLFLSLQHVFGTENVELVEKNTLKYI